MSLTSYYWKETNNIPDMIDLNEFCIGQEIIDSVFQNIYIAETVRNSDSVRGKP